MKNKIHLSISTPCTEKFESFTQTTLGGFCGSCQKEVIDFTHWNEERIKSYFRNKPLNTCGRFQVNQLKAYEYEQAFPLPGWLPKLMMGLLVLFTSRSTIAQTKMNIKSLTEQYDQPNSSIERTIRIKQQQIKISGVVKAAEDSTAIPGVNVVRKGSTDGTVTDADGRFELEIDGPSYQETLIFSFIGYKTTELAVKTHEESSVINLTLTLDLTQLGGAIVVGGLTSSRWDTPRAWWWRFRSLFSRY